MLGCISLGWVLSKPEIYWPLHLVCEKKKRKHQREFTQLVQQRDHHLYSSLCIQMCSWLALSRQMC